MEINKIELAEVKNMTSAQISKYIIDITQTKVCSDKKYCEDLLKIYLPK